jgi:single-strand selective monofunctional uracil DNA glycosylase
MINQALKITADLRDVLQPFTKGEKLGSDVWVYNPLEYAWDMHELFLKRYGASGKKRVIFLGMNPGPFGMAQTGIPFGQIAAVRDWMNLSASIGQPTREHPKRPIDGLACKRSEVSGQRLWGLFAQRFGSPHHFFEQHTVINYCPLVFVEKSGRNLTPDKLPPAIRGELDSVCGPALAALVKCLQPEWLIGVGNYADERFRELLPSDQYRFGKILHPSPASPASARDWDKKVTAVLENLGVW